MPFAGKYYSKVNKRLLLNVLYTVNYGLTNYGALLKAGITIILPSLSYPKAMFVIRIWGRK